MLQYIPLVGGLFEKWMEGRAETKRQSHTEQMAVYEQFAAEFRDLSTRTWWDSLVDGINRMPRPMMTFGVIWLFWYAVDDPQGFAVSAQALTAMPYEGWVALWMVVGFWFGTKAIEKMPGGFGKMKGRAAPKIEINAPAGQEIPNSTLSDHEVMNWNHRKEARYKNDWSNLND